MALTATDGHREVLESLARSRSGCAPGSGARQDLADGRRRAANPTAVAPLSVSRATVANWRTRIAEDGLVEVGQVHEGRGRKGSISDATIETIVRVTPQSRPPGQTHRRTRTMADAAGVFRRGYGRSWASSVPGRRVQVSNAPTSED